MARKFFHISLGILCLVAAYQLGAAGAGAEWGGIESPGHIIGGFGSHWWTADGSGWAVGSGGWSEMPSASDLPVPASEVKFLDGDLSNTVFLITNDDRAYLFNGHWTDYGQFPGGPVALDQQSWAKTKGMHR